MRPKPLHERLKACAIAVTAGSSLLVLPAIAHAAMPSCNSYTNPVYVSGATAAQPILAQIAVALGSSVSVIYQSTPSCIGLADVITNTQETKSALYLDPTNAKNAISCDPTNGGTTTGSYIDVGLSGVYPATCTSQVNVPAPGQNQKDFPGPIQAVTFVAPATSTESAISAEAAYVVFGWSGQSNYTVSPWTDPTQMFVLTPSSGVELLLAAAIGLPAPKWLAQSPFEGGAAQRYSSNATLITALAAASNVNAAIGISATEYADLNRDKVKVLAYQSTDPYTGGDQSCGYLPDSDSTHFDKINVRQGRYAPWGPIHALANTDGSGNVVPNPSNTGSSAAAVASVVHSLALDSTLSASQLTAMIQAVSYAYAIPPCAMEVTRTDEMGAEASYQTPQACGCYFESLAAGTPGNPGPTTSSYCRTCSADADCADAGIYTHCNYGYCEAQ
jgi:hypothetical protein